MFLLKVTNTQVEKGRMCPGVCVLWSDGFFLFSQELAYPSGVSCHITKNNIPDLQSERLLTVKNAGKVSPGCTEQPADCSGK